VTSLQNNLSQLQALYNLHSHKPNVQFYEGKDQVISVFEESLQAEKIYFYFMTEVFQAKLADYLDTFFEKIGKNMIQTYGMVASSLKRNIKQEHTSRNQVIIIPQEYTAQTDFLICDTKIAYIQVKEDTISALVIDDPHICFFEKTRYIMLWKLLSGQKL
ncbi:MAG TPA: hypothetical protein PLS49_08935, partial [Candidatus Woesebacteria bacterium]|nr:hypothetical protein [Candidatus Woesebacteria bacterium]